MDEEDEASTAASAAVEASPDDSCSLANPNFAWTVGSRLESKARDSNGGEQWFPAKVLEVESEGRGVLVHYMQWNARHDEWIPSNSPRLRPAVHCGSSGKSSRHNSGGDLEAAIAPLASPATPTPMPAHKDFKPNEKVMATWKLNRKYLATVIKYEPSDGTYLVEFYDGVQCNVKPNNMRRPRKGEEDLDQQETLRVNGAVDNESAENSDNDDSPMAPSSGRRERKRKFDVKELLNIRSVKSLRSNSKEDSIDSPGGNVTATTKKDSAGESTKRSKRRLDRLHKSEEVSPPSTPAPSPAVVNGGGKARTKSLTLEDGPALAAVSGKRERRKKKFWDEEQDESSNLTSANCSSVNNTPAGGATTGSSANSSLALKRKSLTVGSRVSSPVPRKTSKKSAEKLDKDEHHPKSNGAALSDDGSDAKEANGNSKTTGKENGKVLPYLQFDLSADPELIAEKMIEGVNIPGMGQPIPVDSSSLPDGWEKRVIQRRIGITKGKWDVFITNPETGKSFRSKTELQKHLDERKLPYTSDAFDFSLDDNLKRLRQIWKQYKVKPFLNNPKGTGSTNFKHVPAKITQVQDSDIVGRGPPVVTAQPPSNNLAGTATSSASSSSSSTLSSSVPPKTSPQLMISDSNLACLAEIAVESETGQGLRCSISKCGKLFRNNRLLRQHVKHYHPKVYESLLCKHPQIGEDISEPTSPEGRRLSDSEHLNDGFQSSDRKRKPSSDKRISTNIPLDENCTDQFEFAKTNNKRKLSSSSKRPLVDEDTPLSSMLYEQDDDDVSFLSRRTRNDSLLSSIHSDTEDASADLNHHHHHNQPHQNRSSCPPTPPTFRLSKRRQAQMRKRIQQPVIRVCKIDDTPLGRDYRDELLSLTVATSANSVAGSNATSPSSGGLNVLDCTVAASSSSYPPSEMDASVAGSEHLTTEELVNCTCRRSEEDGLMIQCDICLCWQHGYCVGIEDEDPVPEKHVCETCRQPPGGRTESRFSIDQDWLKEGKLPSCEAVLSHMPKWKSSSAIADKETAFRKLSELMADLVNLDKVLHGLRVKLHVASQPSNSKVFMWSSVWSLPTQPVVGVVEPDHVEVKEEAIDEMDDIDRPSQPPSAPVDANAVADKLNLMASNIAAGDEGHRPSPEPPKVNGDAGSCSSLNSDVGNKSGKEIKISANQNTDPPSPSHDHDSKQVEEGGETLAKKDEESSSHDGETNAKTESATGDQKKEEKEEESCLTNGKNDGAERKLPSKYEGTKSNGPLGTVAAASEVDDGLLDASFIPSLSEVERLLPSVIKDMDLIDSKSVPTTNSSSSLKELPPRNVTAGTATPPMFIPEPKRLDRDECRLNLLQHIASVQFEIEKRFTAIEAAMNKIEAMPGSVNAGFLATLLSGSESKIKTKLTMLLQDLAIARQLVWTL